MMAAFLVRATYACLHPSITKKWEVRPRTELLQISCNKVLQCLFAAMFRLRWNFVTVLNRIHGPSDLPISMRKSFLISAGQNTQANSLPSLPMPMLTCMAPDMAHAVHPNYVDKHEAQHRVAIHKVGA